MSETTSRPTSTTTAPAAPRRRPRRQRDHGPTEPEVVELLIDDSNDDGDGIDYEPALAAVDDLAGWAFGLAGKDVADWPEGKRRVRNARRYVHAVLRGKRAPKKPHADLLFTAALLARIFDAEVGLGLDRIGDILGELALPVDHAPVEVRRAPEAEHPRPIAPSAWRHVRSIYQALPATDAEEVRRIAMRLSAAERSAWIAVLTQLSVEDGALIVLAYLRGAIPAPWLAAPAAGFRKAV